MVGGVVGGVQKERVREGEERARERKKAWELRVTGKAGAKTDSDLYHLSYI